jgi:hypothetical protein
MKSHHDQETEFSIFFKSREESKGCAESRAEGDEKGFEIQLDIGRKYAIEGQRKVQNKESQRLGHG